MSLGDLLLVFAFREGLLTAMTGRPRAARPRAVAGVATCLLGNEARFLHMPRP